jgi:hypothetical protein
MKIPQLYLLKRLAFISIALPLLIISCKHETVEPEIEAPSNLVYNPNTMSVIKGTSMSSNTPSISGGTPITYSLSTIPNADNAITINQTSGVITADSTASIGTYQITVVAKNSKSSVTFTNVFTISVGVANPVTFIAKIKPLITSNCSSCHTPGGSSLDFTDYTRAKGNINTMINRINRAQGSGGFMPQGGTALSAANIALFEQWRADGLVEN